MHADIAREIQVIPSGDRAAQQRACSKWRQEFNHVRPHDAIGDKTPAEIYKRSERVMRKHQALYPSNWLVRKVSPAGRIRIVGEMYFVSGSLGGYQVGLQPVDELHWRAWFYDVDLGVIESAPAELPKQAVARIAQVSSVPACSNASSVRARSKRAPASPRLTRSVRASKR